MRHRRLFSAALLIGICMLGCAFWSKPAFALTSSHRVCDQSYSSQVMSCHAQVLNDGTHPFATSTPQGYGPAVFKAAYGVNGTARTHVAVITAFDAPYILDDLATFSRTFGLPGMPVCTNTTQAGCLEKSDQAGSSTLPAPNSSWAVEASLDVESVHGMCPHCRISLVEATSPSLANLSAAVNEAAKLGASVISNSYGGPESANETTYDTRYQKPNVTTVVSSGDDGYGTEYPAASPGVVAVGGTHLQMNATDSKVVSETAWQGAGSGCSIYEAKPRWQHDTVCTKRSVADISADADPATGAAIYDSYPNAGHSGWYTVGGTSLAAPLIAGIIASSGLHATQPAYLYNNAGVVTRDILSGANGLCRSYLCTARNGYDGPTGLGVVTQL